MGPSIGMNKKEFEKLMQENNRKQQLKMLEANRNRAQSVTIGPSGGSGAIEITMRGEDGTFLWTIYQPAQITELVNQLAASIGCHIHIQPRQDFASWRTWLDEDPLTEQDRKHLNGFAPFANYKLGHSGIGAEGLKKRLQVEASLDESKHKEPKNVATKKAVNKRSPKRTRTPAK